jgi:hypothetical protein
MKTPLFLRLFGDRPATVVGRIHVPAHPVDPDRVRRLMDALDAPLP